MPSTPNFDLIAAHRYFAAHCYNEVWDLLDKPNRSAEEDRRMVALSQASIYHWLNRPDCGDEQLSIGYWQVARVQAVLGNADEAQRWASVCLSFSEKLLPFYHGYAYEALGRAALLKPDLTQAAACLTQAEELAAQVAETEDHAVLEKDLAELRVQLNARLNPAA